VVIDTSGRAQMRTFRVVSSTHDLFSAAVASHLPTMLFEPAIKDGMKVRQEIRMPFVFEIAR
jgi:protein TonB